MAGLDDILKALPIDQIAAQLGVDPSEARRPSKRAARRSSAGCSATRRPRRAPRRSRRRSASTAARSPAGAVDLNALDTADGEKILGHIFGGQEQAVAQKLTDEPKTAGIDFGKLLPILAPIVMGLIANSRRARRRHAGRVRRRAAAVSAI